MSKKITTIEMELAVAVMFGIRANVIVPNISWGMFNHECDLIVIRPSGYATEVEIKISYADFKADFKKEHNHNDNRIKSMYYALPESLVEKCKPLIPEHIGIITVGKHFRYDCIVAEITRKAVENKSRKLTTEEMFKAAQLGCIRIWALKRKVITTNKLF